MTKQQLIEALSPELIQQGNSRKDVQSVLETYTIPQLGELVRKQQNKQNPGLKTEAEKALKFLESIQATKTKIAQVQRERVNDWIEHEIQKGLDTLPEREAERKQKEANARALFPEVCRRNRIAPIEANFKLLFEADLLNSEFEATEAIGSNAVSLAPASSEQIAAWQAEEDLAAIEQHNTELLRLADFDPDQLRARVRQEAEHARVATAQAEADNALAAAQARDAHVGFSKLPDVWQGHRLDAAFIRTCDTATHKLLAKKFGNAQLTARLRGAA